MTHDASIEGSWTRSGVLTLVLCAITGGIDSFDTQMIGFTGSQIAADLRFPVSDLGWLFSAGQLGGVVGAFLFGSLADRFGAFRMLIVSSLLAALLTAATLATQGYGELLVCRMLAGIGLGGMLPSFLSLGVEAMPVRVRVAMTPVLYASFPAGGMIGAWISAPLIAAYGWRGVFALAAGMIVVVAGLLAVLPINRVGAATSSDTGSVSTLFTRRLRRITLWLWMLFLLAPSGVYLLVMWVPALLQLLGTTPARASVLVGFVNLGGLAMALGGGWLMHRFGRLSVLGPVLLIGAISVVAFATVHHSFDALVGLAVVAGAALGGGVALLVSVVANAYPASMRATGIGWALGIARIGQMSTPIPIGLLLGAGVAPRTVLVFCGVPPLLALIPLVMADRAIRAGGIHGAT